jgi:hypothetical protein
MVLSEVPPLIRLGTGVIPESASVSPLRRDALTVVAAVPRVKLKTMLPTPLAVSGARVTLAEEEPPAVTTRPEVLPVAMVLLAEDATTDTSQVPTSIASKTVEPTPVPKVAVWVKEPEVRVTKKESAAVVRSGAIVRARLEAPAPEKRTVTEPWPLGLAAKKLEQEPASKAAIAAAASSLFKAFPFFMAGSRRRRRSA